MAVTDLDARADRVRAIVEGHFGCVVGCNGDMMLGEVPADISVGLNALWGEGGFERCQSAGFISRLQTKGLATALNPKNREVDQAGPGLFGPIPSVVPLLRAI